MKPDGLFPQTFAEQLIVWLQIWGSFSKARNRLNGSVTVAIASVFLYVPSQVERKCAKFAEPTCIDEILISCSVAAKSMKTRGRSPIGWKY